MPVLLIDSDPRLGRDIRQALVLAKFTTEWVVDACRALELACSREYEVVLVRSTGLCFEGQSMVRALRARGVAASVIVLDRQTSLEHRIAALDAGADDCLAEPFDLRELLAMVRAAIRRTSGNAITDLMIGTLRVDPLRRVAYDGDRRMELTSTELDLLAALMRSSDKFLPKERLGELIYGAGDARASNAIQVHLHNLRRKLKDGAIENVRGEGYRIAA